MTTAPDPLFPIGDVARRTGLSVSAVRFYSDEGIVPATDVTAAGHRLYGAEAVAKLDFIRTMRELGTGLEQVRQVLTGETTLHYLLAEHLDVVERQERNLRTRRAVLRALVSQQDPARRAGLLGKLVTMPDAERERLITDFWQEVSADVPADVADRVLAARPRLAADPTAAQLEAWITLAELLQDPRFRDATRSYLQEVYTTGPGATISTAPVQDFIAAAGEDVMPKLMAAHASGLAPDDPHARELAAQLVLQTAAAMGAPVDDELWERIASGFPQIDRIYQESLQDPDYAASYGRYLSLVATINGEDLPDAGLEAAPGPGATGTRASVLSTLGPWLSSAILAARASRARS
ncbi:DNA-binding transcriptional regulator, MerR family [Promicromonospora umidemergens]|uniref:MerR family transcriptional regulator n=1 Tax=Promicromonospora umidemergens TaxID=629679 RepID=A0ABP8WW24_9MICO|nr:MerR family transcriptional regulator [Promicromonospora umidemergens]MCP2285766.1 DNA-binding transcriptional regulator, MerR family [Promicromonospora umidemergens]